MALERSRAELGKWLMAADSTQKLVTRLRRLGACEEAAQWAKGSTTWGEAWGKCERGDWMLWIAGRGELCSRQDLVLAACSCARLALKYTKRKEVLECIEAAEGWARGEVGMEVLQERRRKCYAAYAAYATAYATAYAAYATADAAYATADADAAYATAYAAADAAYAYAAAAADAAYAYAAAAAAAYAAYAARTATLKRCADLVRERIKFTAQG